MRRLTYTWYCVLLFFLISTAAFQACGGGGGGGSEGTDPVTVTASDGTSLTTPKGGDENDASMTIQIVAGDSNMAPDGETLVSNVIEISTAADHAYSGDGTYTVTVPVDSEKVSDPKKLQMNVRLRSGIVMPVYGVYDEATGNFVAYLSGIVNGWYVAVTENPSIEILTFSRPTTKSWLTDLDWETYEWMVVNHSDMSAEFIEENIMPELWGASETLDKAGFRSPRIYVDPRLDPSARVVHILQGTGEDSSGSHFSSGSLVSVDGTLTYSDEVTGFSTEFLTDDEMTALGKMYINYDQYEVLKEKYGISLGNIIIHELFHAVQFGYDIRKSGELKTYVYSNGETIKRFDASLKAYTEGTATPLGQTYQETNGSVTGPTISVRSLRSNEHARLYQAADSPDYPAYYTKQDFFAYVAKRYNNNNWAYADQLFEYMNTETAGQDNKTVAEYLALYRNAMDKCFKALFSKSLPEIYTTYARDRAYEHGEYAALRSTDTEENGFVENSFYWPLFRWSDDDERGVRELESKGLTFEAIPPLATVSFWASLPEPSEEDESFELSLTLKDGSVSSGDKAGVKIVAYLEDEDEIMIEDGKIEITDISKPVAIPLTDSPTYLTVLVSNAYVENRNVTLTVSSGPYIEKLSPANPLPGDKLTIAGAGFGSSQGSSTIMVDGTEIGTVTYWGGTMIILTLPDDIESGALSVKVNGMTSNEVALTIGTPSPNWEMTLNIDIESSDPNITVLGEGGMPMAWTLLQIYNAKIPVSVSENGVVAFNYDWSRSGSHNRTVSHHVEGTGTFDGRELTISGSWASTESDTNASDGSTSYQSDSGTFTGTGRYISGLESYYPTGFTGNYSSYKEVTSYDSNGDVTNYISASCTGSIPYFQLSEIDEFIKM